jgi:MFS family permease
METPLFPDAFHRGRSATDQLGDLFLYARHLCRGYRRRQGWSSPQIYLGLTLAMLMMAAVSPFVARLLARFGGRLVVTSGTLLIAASCAMMAWSPSLAGWYGAWLLTGIGMRLSV